MIKRDPTIEIAVEYSPRVRRAIAYRKNPTHRFAMASRAQVTTFLWSAINAALLSLTDDILAAERLDRQPPSEENQK